MIHPLGEEGMIGVRVYESDWSVNSSCGRHIGGRLAACNYPTMTPQ
jgi:hypothetical protein